MQAKTRIVARNRDTGKTRVKVYELSLADAQAHMLELAKCHSNVDYEIDFSWHE